MLCPIRPFMFSGSALFENLVIDGLPSAGLFKVCRWGLLREINRVCRGSNILSTALSAIFVLSVHQRLARCWYPLPATQAKSWLRCQVLGLPHSLLSVSFSGFAESLRAMTNESLQFSLKTSNASVSPSSAIMLHQVKIYLSSIPAACPQTALAIRVPHFQSAAESACSRFHPERMSLPFQNSLFFQVLHRFLFRFLPQAHHLLFVTWTHTDPSQVCHSMNRSFFNGSRSDV